MSKLYPIAIELRTPEGLTRLWQGRTSDGGKAGRWAIYKAMHDPKFLATLRPGERIHRIELGEPTEEGL